MQLARIDGVVISTVCHPSMRGHRTVICQPLDENGIAQGLPVLAIDPLGAGLHQRIVLHADGGATREFVRDEHSPLRNMVCALVDETTPDV